MAAIIMFTKPTKHLQKNAQKFVLAKKTESSQLNDILGWVTIGLLPSPCLAPDIDLIRQCYIETFTCYPSIARFSHVSFDPHLNNPGLIDHPGISIAFFYNSNDPTLIALNLDKIWSNSTFFLVNSQTYLESFHIFAKSGRLFPRHHDQETARHLRAETLGGQLQ